MEGYFLKTWSFFVWILVTKNSHDFGKQNRELFTGLSGVEQGMQHGVRKLCHKVVI